MYDNLHIEEMRNALGNKTEITIRDIDDFYCSFSPDIPFSTVKWRIHSLIDKGILHRIGHGRYRFGEEKIFFPDIFRKTMDIARIMRKQFPFADYCQWNFLCCQCICPSSPQYRVVFCRCRARCTRGSLLCYSRQIP